MFSISRKDLYDEVWSVGMTKAAQKLDIPYYKLKKACVDHDIPLPTQSYWVNCIWEMKNLPNHNYQIQKII